MFELFNRGYKNPAEQAMPYMRQISSMGHRMFDPYVSGGREAFDRSRDEYTNLVDDPSALIHQIMEGYQESPLKRQMMEAAMRGIKSQAAAGGQYGTIPTQIEGAEVSADIANRFLKDYMDRVLGVHTQGLEGLGRISDTGFRGAEHIADLDSSSFMNQAQLAAWAQALKNQQGSNFWNDVGKITGAIKSFF